MIAQEKWMILTPLQKLPNNVGNLGKIIIATGFEWLPKVQKISQSCHTATHPWDLIPTCLFKATFYASNIFLVRVWLKIGCSGGQSKNNLATVFATTS